MFLNSYSLPLTNNLQKFNNNNNKRFKVPFSGQHRWDGTTKDSSLLDCLMPLVGRWNSPTLSSHSMTTSWLAATRQTLSSHSMTASWCAATRLSPLTLWPPAGLQQPDRLSPLTLWPPAGVQQPDSLLSLYDRQLACSNQTAWKPNVPPDLWQFSDNFFPTYDNSVTTFFRIMIIQWQLFR